MSHHVRRNQAVCLLCLSLPLLAGCSAQFAKQQQAQDDLGVAMQRAQVGKIQESRQWADRAIAVNPKSISTYVYAPTDVTELGRLAIADPGDGEHGVFSAIGDDADVVSYMTQAADAFPNSPLPLQVMDQAQGRLGDTTGQRATAAKLAAMLERQMRAPGHALGADLINQLAQAYWDAGDAVNGAANYNKVIAIYPRDPAAITADNNLAYAYAVTDDKAHLAEGLALAQKAIRLAQKQGDPEEEIGGFQDTLGWLQYRLGDYKNALVNVQQGVSSNPRLPEGRYHLAMVFKALGNVEAARVELNYALRLSQGYAAAKRELASLPKAASSA